ncbi:MAG TPA: glutaredoxin family protein [Povalibacter sp.]|nr:glutaredoxin family protein [Povalibacter sp.]
MTAWTIYTRPACSLCEQLMVDLAGLLGPAAAAVRVVDITDDSELETRYGRRIPVLLADGEFVCAYRLDEERVRAYLTGNNR